jgi:hypothetical protein
LSFETEADQAALIALRYLLADALELCGVVSGAAKSDAAVVEHFLACAVRHVMSALQSPKTSIEAKPAGLLSSAA